MKLSLKSKIQNINSSSAKTDKASSQKLVTRSAGKQAAVSASDFMEGMGATMSAGHFTSAPP